MLSKNKQEICERIAELEGQIMIAKNIDLPYDIQQKELDKLYQVLDGGVVNETNAKKNKKENRRLF